jgi:hypothetical protein
METEHERLSGPLLRALLTTSLAELGH